MLECPKWYTPSWSSPIEIVRSSVFKSGSETDSIFYHVRSAKGHIIDAIDEIEKSVYLRTDVGG